MTEPRRKKKKRAAPAKEPSRPESTRELDIGKWLVAGVPLGTAILALAVGIATSPAPAILVLVAGVILGAVLLFWGSVRSLTGEAPLQPSLAAASIEAEVTEAQERKKRALRALKDLEGERAVGKLDDEDYEILSAQYRAEAKEVLRELDAEIEPMREKAESLVAAFLAKQGLADRVSGDVTSNDCPICETPNDADAAFCKKCGEKLDVA